MNCSDFINLPTGSIREQMRDLGSDGFIIFDELRRRKVILVSQGIVGRSALFEFYCRGFLWRAEFDDGDVGYKAKPEIMLEFEQYLRE